MSESVAYLVGGDNWVPCYVSLYSLLKNNPSSEIDVFIFSEEDRNKSFFENINRLRSVHQEFAIEFIQIPADKYKEIPRSPNQNAIFPREMYFKLLIPELLSDPPDELLYLDADTLVTNSLRSLFELNLSEDIVAAAPDTQNKICGLGVPLTRQYFNAGVMYINTEAWLETNITEKSLEFIKRHKPSYMDQTALNAVLHRLNDVRIISPEYNLVQNWAESADENIDVSFDWENIKIIHYAGVPKPWHYRANNNIHDHWIKYYEKTPFEDFKPKHRNPWWIEYAEEALEPFPRVQAVAECIYQNVT